MDLTFIVNALLGAGLLGIGVILGVAIVHNEEGDS